MVQLHVKRGDESQFLFNTSTDAPLETVIQQVAAIYNGRLKVDRICSGKNLSSSLPVLLVKDPHPKLQIVRAVLQLHDQIDTITYTYESIYTTGNFSNIIALKRKSSMYFTGKVIHSLWVNGN
ncbi:hypothetical protein AMECASPLE_000179 [Ameca splendens]|uniref:FERM domain-containing protein n=1 Tax=Ameca splendens TaxID=208324 RepID=A0ABV0YKR3_9TELE